MMISTSILNSSDRVESVIELNRTNTSYIHIDVMDGKFVSDTQFSVKEIGAINLVTKYPMDVHLMVNDPVKYIDELGDMNISYITFHLEIKKDIKKIISRIRELGYKVGISIKPNTDIEELVPYLKEIDMVLVMSVEPGLGGQKFLNGTVKRVKDLRKIINKNGYDIKIEVDGGINEETITKLDGVDIAVVGSYIVKSDNYYRQIEKLLNVKKVNNNVKRRNIISNSLILSGLVIILVAFYMNNGFILGSIIQHPFIFLGGFILLALGIFMKPFDVPKIDKVRKNQILKDKKLLYIMLLILGVLPFIAISGLWIFLMIIGEHSVNFYLFMLMASLVMCWPIEILGILLIVVSVVRLNEIKRLSKK